MKRAAITQSIEHRMVPSIATPLANHLARREIERQMQAKGLRITRYADVVAQARTYLAEHPELFARALEIVRTSPWHRAQADREQRELERERRKRTRAGIVENPTAQTCLSIR